MIATLLVIIAFLTSFISGVIGMGGGTILLAAMILSGLVVEHIVPLHGVVQLCSNGSRIAFLFRQINIKITVYFLCGIPLGGYIGYLLLQKIDDPSYLLLGMGILLVYVALKPKKLPDLKLPDMGFFFLGVLAAGVGCLVGITGPLVAPFFVRNDWDKKTIIATMGACQTGVHFIKIPVFISMAFPYSEYLWVSIFMIVAAVLGSRVGVYVLTTMYKERFFTIVRIAMLLIAIRVLYKFFVM